jgi:carboxylesterase
MIRNVEYFLEGDRSGVLLIHGLTGTPTEMRFVANGLHHEHGFTVHGMQLAGHCGDEADLLVTDRHDWIASAREALDGLRRRVDHVFVAGLSMGAVLALRLAIDAPDAVDGVALYGTSLFYDGWAMPPIARLLWLLPFAVSLGIGRRARFMEPFPYGIKNKRMRDVISVAMIGGDSAGAGLPGNPWPSLAECLRLSSSVRRSLHLVKAPCLVVHARDDDVASLRNVRVVRQRVPAPVEFVQLENSYHMITVDQERGEVVRRSAGFFRRVVQPDPEPISMSSPT